MSLAMWPDCQNRFFLLFPYLLRYDCWVTKAVIIDRQEFWQTRYLADKVFGGQGILAGKGAGMKVIAMPNFRYPAKAEKLAEAEVGLNSVFASLVQLDKALFESLSA